MPIPVREIIEVYPTIEIDSFYIKRLLIEKVPKLGEFTENYIFSLMDVVCIKKTRECTFWCHYGTCEKSSFLDLQILFYYNHKKNLVFYDNFNIAIFSGLSEWLIKNVFYSLIEKHFIDKKLPICNRRYKNTERWSKKLDETIPF